MADTNTGMDNSGYGNSGDRNSGHGNSGHGNSGYGNSGHGNSGHGNSGHGNSGYGNSGDRNSGNRNSGDGNSGDGNSGDRNSGNRNSGDGNSGNGNSGYGNSTDRETGIFNTTQGKIRCFNTMSDKTFDEIDHPHFDEFYLTQWIEESEMTDEEKKADPGFFVRGGYLKKYSYAEAWSNFWRDTDEDNKKKFLALPNFNAEIFKEITGIDVESPKETIEIGGRLYDKKEFEEKVKDLKPIN